VAEARGLIAGTSRILSSLDLDAVPGADAPAVEPWRPVVVPAAPRRAVPFFRLTPARSAIAAVLVVAVATAIVREHDEAGSRLASTSAERAVVANAPAAAPMAGASPSSVPVMSAPVAGSAAPGATPVPPAVAQLDTTAGSRVATARTFAKAQRETTVNADLARVAAVPPSASTSPAQQTIAAAKVADSMAGAANRVELRRSVSDAPMSGSGRAAGVAGGVARAAAPAFVPAAAAPTSVSIEEPQCYRVESATGAAATWGPVALPFVLALDAPATGSSARVLTPAGQDAEARAVFQRRGGDSLLFTLRRIGYTGTLAVGAPGEVRTGVMRSTPATTLEQAASPAVPVVVRKVGCKG
jgi:hypothetical protein